MKWRYFTAVVIGFCGLAVLWADDTVKHASTEQLTVRTYSTDPSFFFNDPKLATVSDRQSFDVKQQLMATGAQFLTGTSARYTPATKKLVVINYPNQLELIGELVNAGIYPCIQTPVGARFVEINQKP